METIEQAIARNRASAVKILRQAQKAVRLDDEGIESALVADQLTRVIRSLSTEGHIALVVEARAALKGGSQ